MAIYVDPSGRPLNGNMLQEFDFAASYHAALASVLSACVFRGQLDTQRSTRLLTALHDWSILHSLLPPSDRNHALFWDPCTNRALQLHLLALTSASLPKELRPQTPFPIGRLPTKSEWYSPGPLPDSPGWRGPEPGSHAAVLRFWMEDGVDGLDGKNSKAWSIAGYYLLGISQHFPDIVQPLGTFTALASPVMSTTCLSGDERYEGRSPSYVKDM